MRSPEIPKGNSEDSHELDEKHLDEKKRIDQLMKEPDTLDEVDN